MKTRWAGNWLGFKALLSEQGGGRSHDSVGQCGRGAWGLPMLAPALLRTSTISGVSLPSLPGGRMWVPLVPLNQWAGSSYFTHQMKGLLLLVHEPEHPIFWELPCDIYIYLEYI